MKDNANTQASTDKNQHIREFLGRYVDLPYPPNYAVLLTGPWGVGKTHLVKEFLKKKFGQKWEEGGKKYSYVSLYDLSRLMSLIPPYSKRLTLSYKTNLFD